MMHRARFLLPVLFCLLLPLAACQPAPEEPPAPPTATLLPTAILLPTSGCSGADCQDETATQTPDPMRFVLPTPGAEPLSSWRPPLYPIPWAPTVLDHFYFARPIAADTVNWPVADYRYGGGLDASNGTHTGIDIPAALGTPVLASGPGDVVWAGWGLFTGNPKNKDDPFGLAVMIRHDFGYDDKQLYTVYAHMQQVDVVVGQWLETGDPLGQVGETGHAVGPHLHFEVRLGVGDNFTTRNPELWLAPPQGWGVLVGSVTGLFLNPLDRVPVTVESLDSGQVWEVHTYHSQLVNEDDHYAENLVLSDLPAGAYLISVPYKNTVQETEVQVYPGRVTYFTFRGFSLFSTEPPEVLDPELIQTAIP